MYLTGKLFLLFLKPLTWFFILFIIALLSRNAKRKKRLFISALLILIIFSNPFLYRYIATAYEAKPVQLNQTYSAGFLLGGFVFVRGDTKQFSAASDRFIQTALLYKKGNIKKIIFSGGAGNHNEGRFIKERLMELGIPNNDIYIDPFARNTYENAVNTQLICDSLHLQPPYIMITSAMHIERAQNIFEKKGMQVIAYPADFVAKHRANNFMEDYILPSSATLYRWESLLKEMTGLLAYKLFGKA